MQRVVPSVESNVRNPQLKALHRRRRGRALCADFGELSRVAAATVAASLATAHFAGAALTTWDGGGSDPNFGNALNWSNDTVPSAGDILVFDGFTRPTPNNDLAAGFTFGGIDFAPTAGAFTLAGNGITLGGDISDDTAVLTQSINLNLALNATRNINVTDSGFLNIGGVISGTGFGFTKIGNGTLTLSGLNTFTGPVTVNGGVLNVSADAQLGAVPAAATPGQIVIDGGPNGGTLRTTASFTLNANRGIAIGPGSGAGNGTINVASGTTLTYGGVIANNAAGTGSLLKYSFGTLTLSGANTYTGTTAIRNGAIVLNFADAAAPASNIIAPSSALTLGGSTAGLGQVSNSSLFLTGKASSANTQTFASTNVDIYGSVIQATNGATGGTMTVNLGGLTHTLGGTLVVPTQSGVVNTGTSVAGTHGILGGWAIAGTSGNSENIIRGTDFATVDGTGRIVPYTGYVAVPNYDGTAANTIAGNAAIAASGDKNVRWALTGAAEARVDAENANTTTDINTLAYNNGANSGVLTIGTGNTLRFGQFGGIYKQNTDNAQIFIGGTGGATSLTAGTTNVVGHITAGGPVTGTPGELVITLNGTNNNNGGMTLASDIVDNGPGGTVTLVKTGIQSLKIDGHNTFTGGVFINQGRFQLAGSELDQMINPLGGGNLTLGNPDGLGTGTVTVAPGGYLFVSGVNGTGTFTGNGAIAGALPNTAQNAPIINNMTISGIGDNREPIGAIRIGARSILSGQLTLGGDARVAGSAAAAYPAINPDGSLYVDPGILLSGKITGPFSMDFGAGVSIATNLMVSNPANDWTGNTTVVSGGGTTRLRLGDSEVIPDGVGKGNLNWGAGANQATLDMNGFSETVNGLSTAGTTTPGNAFIENNGFTATVIDDPNNPGLKTYQYTGATSTLTVGNFDQTATFGGTIRDFDTGNSVTLPDPNTVGATIAVNPPQLAGNKVALTKIGTGIQTLAGNNTYTGDTNINNGALSITGSLAQTGAVNVNTSSTTAGELNGTGSVGNVTLAANNGSHKARVAPGATGGLGTIGQLNMNALTVNGGELAFDLNAPGSSDTINVSNAAVFNGTAGKAVITPSPTGQTGAYTLINANGGISYPNSGTPTLNAPTNTRNQYTLNATGANQLVLNVINNAKNLVWTGSVDGAWDVVNKTNWTDGTIAERFFNGDTVNFNNGPTNRNVTLNLQVLPSAVVFNNDVGNDYTIGGAGGITGGAVITKNGTGAATLGTNNTYSGRTDVNAGTFITTGTNTSTSFININAGTVIIAGNSTYSTTNNQNGAWLQIGNGGSTGSLTNGDGGAMNNQGVMAFNRLDSSTFGTQINGGGEVRKLGTGTLTLTAANGYTGITRVQNGTLRAGTFNALGGGSVGVESGGAFDLAGPAANVANGFGNKLFTIAGTGVGGTGAIVDTGNAQTEAFQTIALAADATIGGTARFDMRNGTPSLNLNGNTLTKAGTAEFRIANGSVSDGNIVVAGGSLGFEGTTNVPDNATGKKISFAGTGSTTGVFVGTTGNISRPMSIDSGTVTLAAGSFDATTATSPTSTVASNILLNNNLTLTNLGGNATFTTGTLALTGVISEAGGARTVTKTGAGTVILAGNNTYTGNTVVNAGTLVIGGGTTSGAVAGPVTLNAASLVFNRTDAATVAGQVSGSGVIYQVGPGTSTFGGGDNTGGTNVVAGALVANSHFGNGTLNIADATSATVAPKVSSSDPNGLTIVPSLVFGGAGSKLDLTNNSLAINYTVGNSPYATVRAAIVQGYNGGSWTGNGITSSAAAAAASGAHRTALGVVDAGDGLTSYPATFVGKIVDPTSVRVRYTYAGDSNLDGTVDLTDFTFLAASFNGTGKKWLQGDYNYDGSVDLTDFTFLASNFNQTLAAPDGGAAGLGSLVPEPGSLMLLGLGAAAVMGRRRRRGR